MINQNHPIEKVTFQPTSSSKEKIYFYRYIYEEEYILVFDVSIENIEEIENISKAILSIAVQRYHWEK